MELELLPEEAAVAVATTLQPQKVAVAAELHAAQAEKAAVAVEQPEKLSVAVVAVAPPEKLSVAVATDHRFPQVALVALERLQHIMADNCRPWTLTVVLLHMLHGLVHLRWRRPDLLTHMWRVPVVLLRMLHSMAMRGRCPGLALHATVALRQHLDVGRPAFSTSGR